MAVTLPSPFIALGEAVRPVSGMVARRMADAPRQADSCADVAGFVSRDMQALRHDLEKLSDEINGGLGRALAYGASDSRIQRAASRVEARIERMLDNFDDVRRLRLGTPHAEGLRLLDLVYRDVLREVQAWLHSILGVLDDPLAAVRQRGLPTTGKVHLDIWMNIDYPRYTQSLVRWLDRQRPNGGRDGDWLPMAAMAFGLGWLIGRGDGDDDG